MIFRFFYSIALLCWGAFELLFLVKKTGKSTKWFLLQKIGLISSLPPLQHKRIWLHSVSLGETKAVEPLIDRIKQKNPETSIICSHATLTGHIQSSKNPQVDFSFILPIDISFIMKRIVKKICPQLFILVESDYWPCLLYHLRKQQIPIAVVNGKLSERTFNAYSRFSFLKEFTLEMCDQILVQNQSYLDQFLSFQLKRPQLISSGNLKFDIKRKYSSLDELQDFSQVKGIPKEKKVVTFSCSHETEEELVLEEIVKLLREEDIFIIIAPRHIERAPKITNKLKEKGIDSSLFSFPSSFKRVLIVDQIGVLDKIYQLSTITVLCGSLVPGIGGHNLFEPLEAGTSLIYGCYINDQKEMDFLVNRDECGLKVSPLF